MIKKSVEIPFIYHVRRLPSHGERYELVDCFFSGGFIFFPALIVLEIALITGITHGIGNPQGSALVTAIKGVLLFLSFYVVLLPYLAIPYAFHSVRILEGSRLIQEWVIICRRFTTEIDYAWLPEGESLLVAQSDEFDWDLKRYDLHDGQEITWRPITNEDWARLEPLWMKYSDTLGESVSWAKCGKIPAISENYEGQCRRFFNRFLPQQFCNFPPYIPPEQYKRNLEKKNIDPLPPSEAIRLYLAHDYSEKQIREALDQRVHGGAIPNK